MTTSFSVTVKASDYPPYVYLAEDLDPVWQDTNTAGVDNYVFQNWQFGNSSVWWADSVIEADAEAAINSWKASSMIPNLTYQRTTGEGGNLNIYYDVCPNLPAAVSCFKVSLPYYNSDYRASFIAAAAIYVSGAANLQWPGSARQAAIAHEIGKFYGLHERSLTSSPACNPDELTIMDMLQKVQVGDHWEVSHCDGITGPTLLDKWRVEAFWSGGAPLHADLPISPWGNGSVATFRWHDLAWAEKKHYLDFQYQISSSSPWVTYIAAPNYIAYTGTHMYTQDRGMGIAIDISQPMYSNVPPGVTWHRACGWAWFDAYQTYGNGQCSMPVQLLK